MHRVRRIFRADGVQAQRLAGTLLLVGATVFFIGLAASESLFPGYSVSSDTISDLGAPIEAALNPQGSLVIQQPASIVYVLSLSFLTACFVGSAFLLRRGFPKGAFWKVFFVFAGGLVALPLSYIPYYVYVGQQLGTSVSNVPTGLIVGAVIHDAFSGLVFFFGGLSAIGSRKLVVRPLDSFFTLAGAVAIGAAGLSGLGVDLGLGFGGIERVVAYPILIWSLAFGGCLVSAGQVPKTL